MIHYGCVYSTRRQCKHSALSPAEHRNSGPTPTFNKANLKTVLPKFYQHVKCTAMGENTLDHVYTNIKHAYRAIPLPHLGQSDHLSLLLSPAYTPLRRSARPTTKTCTLQTDWDLLEHQELEIFTGMVLDYIQFCIGDVTVDKNIRAFPNQKPWMTSQVRPRETQR
ncbi:hypothetical protein N1851_018691 [Merluccius polli]|uniref:Uncharacterized protein n=1 Tax=Merluccius polli TaxID=89951 RepID=A0AA47MMK8_MERPO|nr:hypothetical protein N1851_018691 [Merluccius polli]